MYITSDLSTILCNLIEFLKKNTVHFSLLFAITLEFVLIVGVAEVTFSEDLDGQEKVQ